MASVSCISVIIAFLGTGAGKRTANRNSLMALEGSSNFTQCDPIYCHGHGKPFKIPTQVEANPYDVPQAFDKARHTDSSRCECTCDEGYDPRTYCSTTFVEKSMWLRIMEAPLSAKLMYAGGNLAVSSIITLIYYERGVVTVISIQGLVFSLSIMSNTIQQVYHLGFRYPEFITACHQLCSAFTAFAILQYKRGITGEAITYPQIGVLVKFLAPIAISFGLSLGCSNLALLYSSTHFYEMLTPMSAVVTFILSYSLGRIKSLKLVGPVLLVAGALPLVAFGDMKMSVLGLIFAMLGVFFRSCKAQLNSLLMSGAMPQTFHPLELTCWTGVLTCCVMLLWSAIQEGLAPYNTIANMNIINALLVSCANATVLNICVLFVMREIGPVAQQFIGEVKGALACVGAVAAFGEMISVQQILGYGLAVVGIFLYNKLEHDTKVEEQAAQKKLKKGEEA